MLLYDDAAYDDDTSFIRCVDAIFMGSIRGLDMPRLWIVRIDNYFDDRWFAFGGKVLGAFGVQKMDPLHLPPFHPHRVVNERYVVRNHEHWVDASAPQRLHVWQNGESNLAARRRANRVADRAAFLWFSSASRTNGNGSAMSYVINGDEFFAWYARFDAANDWRPKDIVGADAETLRRFAMSTANDDAGAR